MSAPELGIAFQGDKGPDAYAHLARLAEDLGFDVLTVYGDLFYQPPLYPLLIMALNTRTVRLGPACFNPATVHPVEIAGQISALDAASKGRAFLGLTRGSWLDRLDLPRPKPLAAMRDTLEIVNRLLRGEGEGYRGEVYSVESGSRLASPPLRSQIPVMIGTWSRRTAGLAARFGDEVKIGGSASPAMARRMAGWLRQDLPAAGRAEDAVGVVMGAVTVVGKDGPAARRRAGEEVAMYLDVVLDLDPHAEVPEGLGAAMRRELRAGDVAAAGALVPDDLLDAFALAGTPEQVSRQVEDLARAGVRRIEFGTPHGYPEEEGIRLLGTRVLPGFRP